MLTKDYSDILNALNDAGVEYLVVGAYALAAYGNVRATGDIDIWVRPTLSNAQNVWIALDQFRAPRGKLKPEDFCEPNIVYQIGVAPNRIDILTSIDGVSFDEAWADRNEVRLDAMFVRVLSREKLLKNKRASGRPKDLADAIWLEENEEK